MAVKDIGDLIDWSRPCAMPRPACELMRTRALELNAQTIVECGSGLSTAYLADAARQTGGRVYTLEHDPFFAVETSRLLADLRLSHHVSMVVRPLMPYYRGLWYERTPLPYLESYDLLLVDGPPEAVGRTPAAYYLGQQVQGEVWLDDADTEHGRSVVEAFEEVGFRHTLWTWEGWVMARMVRETPPVKAWP